MLTDHKTSVLAVTGGAVYGTVSAAAGLSWPGMPAWAWPVLAGVVVTVFLRLVGRVVETNDKRLDGHDDAVASLAEHVAKLTQQQARLEESLLAVAGRCDRLDAADLARTREM